MIFNSETHLWREVVLVEGANLVRLKKPRARSGRSRQISHQEDHHIVRNARSQPTPISAAIQAQVAASLGAPVSSRTVRKRQTRGHLGSRRPLRVLPLTPTYRRLRFVRSDDNRVCGWRPCGERLNSGFALQRHSAQTAGVMVWVAIAYNTQVTPSIDPWHHDSPAVCP
ncbi:transposable element Tcb2 transposase [Trichonephila clavipes]|nr:transposable element Tcb2 transposase [Trichonephila clavipes]